MAPHPHEFDVPKFEADVPPFDRKLDDYEKWMVKQIMVQRKQGDWIIQRLAAGHDRFEEINSQQEKDRKRLDELDEWKRIFTAKKTVLIGILSVILWPILIAIFVQWVRATWFTK